MECGLLIGNKRSLEAGMLSSMDSDETSRKRFKVFEISRRGESLIDSVNTGVCTWKGSRSTMEDVHRVILWSRSQTHSSSKSKKSCVSFFTVCDGHGGIQAADFVCENLFTFVIERECFSDDPGRALKEGFAKVEESWLKHAEQNEIDGTVGTTVTVAMIVDHVLYVANVGDSDAVLCTKGMDKTLTMSHVPSNPEEKDRIEKDGGVLLCDKTGNCRLGHPVWNPKFINIGVTRAIGDMYFKSSEFVKDKKSGLIAEPTVTNWELTQDDQFMLIASDGFWDVVKAEEAVNVVKSSIHLDSNSICRMLLEISKSRNSRDNITVMLIKFMIPKVGLVSSMFGFKELINSQS